MYKINTAWLYLTDACNLNCFYCFEENRFNRDAMTEKVMRDTVDFLIQNANEHKTEFLKIGLFGGEPTLNTPVMLSMVDEIEKKWNPDTYPKTMRVTLITNGTNFDANLVECYNRLKRLNIPFRCQVSVDGNEKAQTINRGLFHRVDETIPKLIKLFAGKATTHGEITKQSLPYLYDSFIYLKDKGFRSITFKPIVSDDWDNSDVELYRSELKKIHDYCMDHPGTSGYYSRFRYKPKKEGLRMCSLADGYVAIDVYGKCHVCHRFRTDPRFSAQAQMGDIYNGININTDFFKSCHEHNVCRQESDGTLTMNCIAVKLQAGGTFKEPFVPNMHDKFLAVEQEFSESIIAKFKDEKKNYVTIVKH